MEYTAIAKSVRITPRKIGLVADALRSKQSIDAWFDSLVILRKRGAGAIEKTLKSALANALNKGAKRENLVVKSIEIGPGPAFKRYRPSTRGRIHPYKKRTAHIKIILTDDKFQIKGKPEMKQLVAGDTAKNKQLKGENDGSKS